MSKPKILIVDDEEGIRESLNLILEEKFEPILSSRGSECLDILKNNPDIKVVLLDIKMPEKSGLDIIKEIKDLNSQIKIVMVTGYRALEPATEAIKAGASDYIVKPFNSKEIIATVERLLAD